MYLPCVVRFRSVKQVVVEPCRIPILVVLSNSSMMLIECEEVIHVVGMSGLKYQILARHLMNRSSSLNVSCASPDRYTVIIA